MAYGTKVEVDQPYHQVVGSARDALVAHGFVVLTELDLRESMQTQLGVEMPAQIVLGVCLPPVAQAALDIEPSVGLLLPLHVVVREAGAEVTVVEAADPVLMVALTGDPVLEPFASDSSSRLRAALHSLHDVDWPG